MHTSSDAGIGRLPWILAAVAGVLVLTLWVATRIRRSAPADTVKLEVVAKLPAWRPGANWASAVPPVRRPGEAIRIPIYPPWTPSEADALFVLGPQEVFDEYCGKLWKPNLRMTQPFEEYTGGMIPFVTNSRSFREDSEVFATRPVLRVLVAGDSHTDGVCSNSESFPNLCEGELRRRAKAESAQRGEQFDPQSIEVLNAGKGGHSFFNYLGVLERCLDLQPDVFVTAVYGGNDFEEVLSAWHFYFNEGKRPPGQAKYKAEIDAAAAIQPGAVPQALLSLKYFATNPDQIDVAIGAAVDVCVQIQSLCKERGIRWIVLYLPPRLDVEKEGPELNLRKLLRAMKLEPAALGCTDRIADQWITRLLDLGVETVDLRPYFKKSKERLYWKADWHLNLAGHSLAARALVKSLAAR